MTLRNILIENISDNWQNKTKWMILFLSTLLYKALLDLSFIKILGDKVEPFYLDVNFLKILLGTLCIFIIFLFINQFKRDVSYLLYNAYFYVMVVPISTIYGVCNKSTVYFITVMLGSIICLLIIDLKNKKNLFSVGIIMESRWIIPTISCVIVISILAICFYYLGVPSLNAINFDNVYDIRLHNDFMKNKFFNYLFSWTVTIFLPFLVCIALTYKRYFVSIILVATDMILYLYTADKTIFFSMLLIIGLYCVAIFKYANFIMSILFTLLINLISIAALLNFYNLYSYFVRRVLLLPAYLKFIYYEFFNMKPKIGLAGTILGTPFGYEYPYKDGIGVIISKCFFNNDIMNSNTGFLAEGYYRFGIIGIVCSCLILGVIIRLISNLSERTSFLFAIIFSIYPIYTLNDRLLIDSILFGPMLVFVLIVLFFSDLAMGDISYETRIKIKLR